MACARLETFCPGTGAVPAPNSLARPNRCRWFSGEGVSRKVRRLSLAPGFAIRTPAPRFES